MPIKSSVLLRTLSDHAIGSIREQLAADVERLEAYHGKIDGFIADNNRDEPPKECERKPLKWNSGELVCALIRDSDNVCLSTHSSLKNAETHAARYDYPISIVRVMDPTGNECPTERIAPEGCEWGIMRIDTDGWMRWLCETSGWVYCATSESILRFPSDDEAAAYISTNEMIDYQPWPIPPKGGAE